MCCLQAACDHSRPPSAKLRASALDYSHSAAANVTADRAREVRAKLPVHPKQ